MSFSRMCKTSNFNQSSCMNDYEKQDGFKKYELNNYFKVQMCSLTLIMMRDMAVGHITNMFRQLTTYLTDDIGIK